jgi:hypothetical protein
MLKQHYKQFLKKMKNEIKKSLSLNPVYALYIHVVDVYGLDMTKLAFTKFSVFQEENTALFLRKKKTKPPTKD